jgi:hypothetical protein
MEIVKKTPKKAGRPAKNSKKEIRKTIRFSKAEYFIVKEKAAKVGKSVSEHIRQASINATMKPRLTDEERQFVRQLVGMSNNLNQLTKACHQEGLLQAMVYFESYRNQVDEILEKLKT